VNFLPVIDHLGSIASLLSLPIGLLALIGVRRGRHARALALAIALPVAVVAYVIDITDRLGWVKFSEGPLCVCDVIKGWGHRGDALFIQVNSRLLLDYKDHFKMILIMEVPYANIDRMTDTNIEKSALFTITDAETLDLAVRLPTPPHLRVAPPLNSNIGDAFDLLVNFTLVLIPTDLSPEQIRSLFDVQRLGGKIITTYSANVGFTVTEKPKS
jgi:hypothetical protein